MFSVFFFGFLRFPDAPLHACQGPGGYCGKYGKPHSAAEFRGFTLWQNLLFVLWPLGMVAILLIWAADRER